VPQDFLAHLDRLLTPDHRLLIISHVSCLDGRRLPVVEAVRLAHRRGVRVLADGAQSVGQFPIDVAAIGADFYAGSLHKWLLGPAGLGYLVVAQDQLPDFNPGFLPLDCDDENALSAAGRSEVGTHSPSLRLGASHAVELLQRIGLERIETHIRCLTDRLRQGLAHIPGFEMLSPVSWELSSGITSLDFPGCSAQRVQELIDGIWEEYRVVVKFQVDFGGIRISVAAFNSEGEVDRLLAALAQLVPQM
jgi:selenocysteine lyase/cysteine desulfurase